MMASTQLRRTILARAVRPYAFAASLATAVVSWAVLTDQAVGRRLDQWPGDIIGVVGLLTVVMLWYGWWARSDVWMTRGLLWSAGVWAGVGTVLSIEGGAAISGLLAWCWAIASGGAWLLEVEEVRAGGGRVK